MAIQVVVEPSSSFKFEDFIREKVNKNGSGGRPHFIAELAKHFDPKEEVLNICELGWIYNKPARLIAPKYHTSSVTIFRLLQDLEPFKDEIIIFLKTTPRTKRWFNKELETSDYEPVQRYINRAKRDRLKTWKDVVHDTGRVWKLLNYKDPSSWTVEEVINALENIRQTTEERAKARGSTEKGGGGLHRIANACRQVCPQLREKGGINQLNLAPYLAMIGVHKLDIFANELNMIIEALKSKNMDFHLLIFLLHIAVGMREGTPRARNSDAGLAGISWDRFKAGFTKVDNFECKVRGGIWSRNCPVNLFFWDLPSMLETEWIRRGKPNSEKLLREGYSEITQIYREINQACAEYWHGRIDPGLFKELTTLKPHFADKIHCNICWEADIPVEVLAGQYLGKGEGIGLVGRIWLSVETILKYYLSLTQRSQKYQDMIREVEVYSMVFDHGHGGREVALPIVRSENGAGEGA